MTPSRETIRLYLGILASFCFVFWLATVFQVPWLFELGTYDQYTVSILEDGDFNLINQKQGAPNSWMVTPTGNDADMTLPGISAYLAPFFAYRYVQDRVLGVQSGGDVRRFMNVHVLATVFYVLCALAVFGRILAQRRIPHFRKAMVLAAASTPFIWHFFFSSTNTNIFGLAYSTLAFSLYVLIREKREIAPRHLAILGLALGLGLNIRQQLFWIGLLPIALTLEKRRLTARGLAAFGLGTALPLALMAANHFVRYGSPRILVMESSALSFWSLSPDLFAGSLRYLLFGPNGYLFVAPVYLLAVLALFGGVLKKHPLGEAPWLAALAPAFIFLSEQATGFLTDTLGGRHFTEYYFILALVAAAAFQALERKSKRALRAGIGAGVALALWHLLVTACYYGHTDPWEWNLGGQVSPANALRGVTLILGQLTPARDLASLGAVLAHLPLIVPLSLGVLLLSRAPAPWLKSAISGFFLFGAMTFTVFTLLNVTRHGSNVASLQAAGLYRDKVVGKTQTSFLYDGAIEKFRLTSAYYALIGRCDLANETLQRLQRYLGAVRSDVGADPVGFTQNLGQGIIRPSAYEEGGSARALDSRLQDQCALSFR